MNPLLNTLIAQAETAGNNNGNVGLGIGIAVMGIAIGLGLIGYSAMQGMSRQPEAIGRMQTAMLIGMAFVEVVMLLLTFVVLGGLTR
jgi:F-type H+-transporting ATPase subunit c